MSVHLVPNNALGFNRPFTQLVKKVLLVSNQNSAPVAFKVKTTAPKLYCVRPNSGRIEPGDSVEVSVMLQPMKEEPPSSSKCKDKFLIQSTLITPEKEMKDLQDIWNVPGGAGEDWKVHQQKLRVVYLPEDQTVEEEEEEGHEDAPIPRRFGTEGERAQPMSSSLSSPPAPPRPVTPARRETDNLYREDSGEESPQFQHSTSGPGVGIVNVNVHQPSPPSSPPPYPPAPPVVQVNRELELKLCDAQAEIQRLRALLAAVPDPSSTAPESVAPESVPPSEFRRRYVASSDDGASTYYGGTEMGTEIERETVIHHDGVPLQVVIIIALGVFITTYLFF
ncbi:PapD-like protein [Boletus reticuloceps]|uniref:PapD-like protein n=1 Tax=Boletus reticuloceps TaxID=495285 RepID=A0A8I3AC22_9AGAM|nr:PapD-like protein [Boletus reticuloceps]